MLIFVSPDCLVLKLKLYNGGEVEAIQWGLISSGSVNLRADNLPKDGWESAGDEGADGNSGRKGGEEDDDEEGDEGDGGEGVIFCDGECGEDDAIRCKRDDDGLAGEDSVDSEDTFSCISIRSEGLTSETVDNSDSNGVGNTSSLLEYLSDIGLVPGMSSSTPSSLENTISFIISSLIFSSTTPSWLNPGKY